MVDRLEAVEADRELNAILLDPVGFLKTPMEGVDTATKLLPYIAYSYEERLANLYELAMSLKEELRRTKSRIILSLMKETDKDTGKRYSKEKADLMYVIDPTYVNLFDRWLATEAQRRIVAGYLRSLDDKKTILPGQQGRLNRWFDAEREND